MDEDKKEKLSKALLHIAAQIDNLNESFEILSSVLVNHKRRLGNLEEKGLPIRNIIEKHMIGMN